MHCIAFDLLLLSVVIRYTYIALARHVSLKNLGKFHAKLNPYLSIKRIVPLESDIIQHLSLSVFPFVLFFAINECGVRLQWEHSHSQSHWHRRKKRWKQKMKEGDLCTPHTTTTTTKKYKKREEKREKKNLLRQSSKQSMITVCCANTIYYISRKTCLLCAQCARGCAIHTQHAIEWAQKRTRTHK